MTQKMNTQLTNDIAFANEKRIYDETCKNLLANKMILAWLMKECVWEFKDVDVKEIANHYIEGIPEMGKEQVFGGEKIRGLSNEHIGINDGKIFYDIRYRTLAPNGEDLIELIVNVEAQNQYHTGYSLVKRGCFYGCQMISSQHGIEFDKMDYTKIKKVYTIWICRNVPKYLANTITRYDLAESNVVGHVKEAKENYDFLSIVMVYLGSAKDEQQSDLLKLLNQLLSEELKAAEKLAILECEYEIPRTRTLERELEHMCNLSNGIEARGVEKGREAEKFEMAKKLLELGTATNIVAEASGLSTEIIESLKDNR